MFSLVPSNNSDNVKKQRKTRGPNKISSRINIEKIKDLKEKKDQITLEKVENKADNQADLLMQEDESGHVFIVRIIKAKKNETFYKIFDKYDINYVSRFGFSLLHYAIMYDNIEIFNFLLEKGADINIANTNKTTPLHTAVFLRKIEIVKSLIEHGADINAKTSWGLTPLHLAYKRNDVDIIVYLLKNKADKNVVDFCGNKPRHYKTGKISNITTRGRKKKNETEQIIDDDEE